MDHEERAYLSIENIEKTYRSHKREVQALGHISLDVQKGQFISIVGPSGCGKSTLLKIILGVIPASQGEIYIDGKLSIGPQSNIGMVFQSAVLLPWRTVLQNVLLPIEILKLNVKDYTDRALQLLDMVGLKGFEHYNPRELSGGMQQRVGICRALIQDPPIILLDEPFGALDSITREQLNNDVLRIWEQTGKTILLVTHSIDEAVYMSDEIVVMSARPSKVLTRTPIDLPRDRTFEIRSTAKFAEYAVTIRQALGLLKHSG